MSHPGRTPVVYVLVILSLMFTQVSFVTGAPLPVATASEATATPLAATETPAVAPGTFDSPLPDVTPTPTATAVSLTPTPAATETSVTPAPAATEMPLTPTPAVTATVTATLPAETPVATASAPTATPQPAAPVTPTLGVSLVAGLPCVGAGEAVTYTFTLTNPGRTALTGIVVSSTLPAGLYAEAASRGDSLAFRTGQGGPGWQIARLAAGQVISASFRARVTSAVAGTTLTNTLTVSGAGLATPLATTVAVDVVGPRADDGWVTAGGGWLRPLDGHLLLRIGPGALARRTHLTYTPVVTVPVPLSGLRFAFTLDAGDLRGQDLNRLLHGLRVSGAQIGDGAAATAAGHLRYFDRAAQAWMPLFGETGAAQAQRSGAAQTQAEQAVLSTATEGVVLLATTTSDPEAFAPDDKIRGAQSSLYTLSVAYQYDFKLPPGRGGLVPPLGLSYGSPGHSKDAEHYTTLGGGWTLVGADYMERTPHAVTHYTLHLRGAKYTVVADWNGSYYAKEDPLIRIRLSEDQTGGWITWTVTLPDGTVYTFKGNTRGPTHDNPGAFNDARYPIAYLWSNTNACGTTGNLLTDWIVVPVSTVSDPVGNVINYTWTAQTSLETGAPGQSGPDGADGPNGCRYVRTVRLSRITYNQGQVHIDFDYSPNKADRPTGWNQYGQGQYAGWYFFPIHRLTTVRISVSDGIGNWWLVRSYQLAQDNTWDSFKLQSITEQVGAAAYTTSLAYADFSYGGNYGWHYALTTLDDPYGGEVRFDLQRWADLAVLPSLRTRTEWDRVRGIGATWTYTGTLFDANLGGWTQVQVQRPDKGCEWHQYNQWISDPLNGGQTFPLAWRESARGEYKACSATGSKPADADELVRSETTWTIDSAALPVPGTWTDSRVDMWDRPRFIAGTETRTYTLRVPMVRTTYTYDPAYQMGVSTQGQPSGALQFGNVTQVIEYEGTGAAGTATFSSTPLRTTLTTYNPNSDRWILHLAARQQVSTGSGAPFSESYTYYDGSLVYTQTPSQGLKTREAHVNITSPEWDGAVVARSYAYDSTNGNLISTTDENNRTTLYYYDRRFQAFQVCTATPSVNGQTLMTRQVYYGVPGANGNPCGTYEGATSYTFFGLLQAQVDANQVATTYTYDELGRPTSATVAPDTVATRLYTYAAFAANPAGNPFWMHAQQRDAGGGDGYRHTWTYYDGFGRVLQVLSEADAGHYSVVNREYNWRDAVVRESVPITWTGSATPPNQPGWAAANWSGLSSTQRSYDALGRLLQTLGPDGRTTRTTYGVLASSTGNREQQTAVDPNSHERVSYGDPFGRTREVDEYTGTGTSSRPYTRYSQTYYTYDTGDRLLAVQDALNNVTRISYDGLGRKTLMVDPDLGRWWYTYDAAGNLVSQVDARYQETCFYYDALNRLVGKKYHAPGTALLCADGAGTYDVTYTYDGNNGKTSYPLGRRSRMDERGGTYTTWQYDARGRTSEETKALNGTAYTTQYTYTSDDQVASITYPDGSTVVSNGYTPRGQLGQVGGPVAATLAYNIRGQLGQLSVGTGMRTSYGYWDQSRNYGLKSIVSSSDSAGVLQNLTYDYDGVGNVLSITDTVPSQTTVSFGYDDLNRLITARGTYSHTYAYNAIGNLLTRAVASGSYGYTYNASGGSLSIPRPPAPGRYRSFMALFIGGAAAASGPAATYSQAHAVTSVSNGFLARYDAAGNMVYRRETTGSVQYGQAWDAENRLARVTITNTNQTTVTTKFAYDGDGTLVRKDVSKISGPITTTLYVNRYYEKNVRTGEVILYYYAGERRFAQQKGGVVSYLYGDHLGSASVATNASGAKLSGSDTRYYPYGETRLDSGGLPTDRRFTGEREEKALGIYSLGARFYDPVLARFLNPDTIVPQPGNPQALNRYSYSLGNPVKYTDHSGHNPIIAVLAAIWEMIAVPDTAYSSEADFVSEDHPASEVPFEQHVQNIAINSLNTYGALAAGTDVYNLYQLQRTASQSPAQAAEAATVSENAATISAEVSQSGGREAENRALYEQYRTELRREMSEPYVKDPTLRERIHSNYREGASVGSGSTAAAIRQERSTGMSVGNAWHSQKGQDTMNGLTNWLLAHPHADPNDIAAAENVFLDLKDAFRTPVCK